VTKAYPDVMTRTDSWLRTMIVADLAIAATSVGLLVAFVTGTPSVTLVVFAVVASWWQDLWPNVSASPAGSRSRVCSS